MSDVILDTTHLSPGVALNATLRALLQRWPEAVIEDRETGEQLTYPVDLRKHGAVDVYKTALAELSWDASGRTEANHGQLIEVLVGDAGTTIIHEDCDPIVDAILEVLQ